MSDGDTKATYAQIDKLLDGVNAGEVATVDGERDIQKVSVASEERHSQRT